MENNKYGKLKEICSAKFAEVGKLEKIAAATRRRATRFSYYFDQFCGLMERSDHELRTGIVLMADGSYKIPHYRLLSSGKMLKEWDDQWEIVQKIKELEDYTVSITGQEKLSDNQLLSYWILNPIVRNIKNKVKSRTMTEHEYRSIVDSSTPDLLLKAIDVSVDTTVPLRDFWPVYREMKSRIPEINEKIRNKKYQ
jgi:hypothetical protein